MLRKQPGRDVGPQADTAEHQQLLVARQPGQAVPQVVDRSGRRPGDRPRGELRRRAHVEQQLVLAQDGELLGLPQRHVAAEHVGGDEAGHVDGVLRAAERRRVAQLRVLEVVDGHARAEGHRDHVDALVDAARADGLRPQDPAVRGVEDELEADRLRAGVVRGVVERVQVDAPVGPARPLQGGLRGAGHGKRQLEHLADRGALRRRVAARPPEDGVGRDAALAVRRPGERDEGPGVADEVSHLHGVAHGPDGRVARAHLRVDANAAGRAQLQPRFPGEARLRPHADGHQHQAAGDAGAVRQAREEAVVAGLERLHRHPEPQVDAVAAQLVVQRRHHLGVGDAHHLRQALHQHDVRAAPADRLGHLETDVAGADDERGAAPGLQGRDHAVHVLHVAQGQHARVVDPGHGRPQRLRAGAEHQRVVGVAVLAAARALAHHQLPRRAVDPHHLAVHAHVEGETGAQALGRLHEQPRALGDHPAHVVGQAAVREGDVGPPLEQRDLGRLGEPAGARRGARPAGHSSHDREPQPLGHG